MNKLFLLDAYALIYRAYYAFIRTPRINSKGQNTSAIFGFVNTLEEVIKKESPTHIAIAFDPKGGTFRHEAYPDYKAQREETPEGIKIAVPYIKRILEAYRIPVLEVPGFEADDVIGTLATQFSSDPETVIYMMTPDKDYGQLVRERVYMYRPKTGDKDFEILGEKEVCEKYGIESTAQVIDLLGLMGDTADNVPGCPGVGEKTAVKLIGLFGSIDNMLEHTDELKGALRKKVEENIDGIRFSKFLVTIKTDVPMEGVNLDSLKSQDKDLAALKEIFDELEFKTLFNRIIGKNIEEKPKKQKKDTFGGLFDSLIPNEGTNIFEESNLSDIKSTPHTYYLVEAEDDINSLIGKLLTSQTFAFDTETTNSDAICAELVGLSFSVKEHEAFYINVPADRGEALKLLEKFRPVYEHPSIEKVGQNIKYDMTILSKYGIKVQGPLFDTMLAHYIISPELRHNMDYMAEIFLKYKTIHIEELIGPKGRGQKNMRDLSPKDIYEYAAEDADITLRLRNVLEPQLREQGLYPLFAELEMPLVPVLVKMEMNGVRLDTASLSDTSVEFGKKMNEIERLIYELAGESFNISSPKQVGEILFDKLRIVEKAKKTKTGQYVTSEEVLQGLKSKHEIVEKILDYRGYKKLLSTYIDALPQLINKDTGKIHTSYNQAVTTTGRLSSSNPNLQNIPIRDENGKEVRKAFIPDDGCMFFSADYSQIELRIMAHLSGDKNMIESFNTGHDIHAATAAKIFKKPIEEITSDERRKAKTANFGIIYGITTFGLAERMQVSRSEAKELIDEYFATYPDVKAYMEKSIQMAREKGYTETLYGRRCYLPDINSHNATVRGYAERNAINAPIQGTAADIIKVAMARIHQRMERENLRSQMILQVHDELNFSVVAEERDYIEQMVKEEMEKAINLHVPLVAECGWGKNWLEAH